MSIIITFDCKGARLDVVSKLAKDALLGKYPNAHVSVMRQDPPESRAERFSEAQSDVSDAKSTAEELRDELQSWRDNLPENLDSSTTAEMLDEAVSQLEEFINSCEEAEGIEVEFPGMMAG